MVAPPDFEATGNFNIKIENWVVKYIGNRRPNDSNRL